jgi:hypothetical protein
LPISGSASPHSHDLPDDVVIHAKIVVHDLVAHPNDVLPRDFRMLVIELPGRAPCSFADHLNKMRER